MVETLSHEEIEAVSGGGPDEIPPSQGWWDDWWKPRRPPRHVDDFGS